MFEPSQPEGKVVGDLFKDRGQGWAADPADQALERGAQERQRAGPVGLSQQAFIFPPTRVPLPMAAFTAPVRLDHLRHRRRAFLMLVPTGDKLASEILIGSLSGVFGNFLGSGVIAGPQHLSGFGKIGALRVGAHAAELAHDDASVLAVGGRKRGRACSNCRSARARRVG